jgi:hypothetical protein
MGGALPFDKVRSHVAVPPLLIWLGVTPILAFKLFRLQFAGDWCALADPIPKTRSTPPAITEPTLRELRVFLVIIVVSFSFTRDIGRVRNRIQDIR